jgi:hypothetical protein
MLSTGEGVDADALFKRGGKISAIVRHLDGDRGRSQPSTSIFAGRGGTAVHCSWRNGTLVDWVRK